MALTVGTNSYIDAAAAAEYIAVEGLDALTDAENSLIRATKALDRLFGQRFTGAKTLSTQVLQFPRGGATAVPQEVLDATVELAVLLESGANLYAQPAPLVKSESVSVGDITESKTYRDTGYSTNFLYKLEVILSPVLVPTSGLRFADVVRG